MWTVPEAQVGVKGSELGCTGHLEGTHLEAQVQLVPPAGLVSGDADS